MELAGARRQGASLRLGAVGLNIPLEADATLASGYAVLHTRCQQVRPDGTGGSTWRSDAWRSRRVLHHAASRRLPRHRYTFLTTGEPALTLPLGACVEACAFVARVAGAWRAAFEFDSGFFDGPSVLLDLQARACVCRPERSLGGVAGSRSRDPASKAESGAMRALGY